MDDLNLSDNDLTSSDSSSYYPDESIIIDYGHGLYDAVDITPSAHVASYHGSLVVPSTISEIDRGNNGLPYVGTQHQNSKSIENIYFNSSVGSTAKQVTLGLGNSLTSVSDGASEFEKKKSRKANDHAYEMVTSDTRSSDSGMEISFDSSGKSNESIGNNEKVTPERLPDSYAQFNVQDVQGTVYDKVTTERITDSYAQFNEQDVEGTLCNIVYPEGKYSDYGPSPSPQNKGKVIIRSDKNNICEEDDDSNQSASSFETIPIIRGISSSGVKRKIVETSTKSLPKPYNSLSELISTPENSRQIPASSLMKNLTSPQNNVRGVEECPHIYGKRVISPTTQSNKQTSIELITLDDDMNSECGSNLNRVPDPDIYDKRVISPTTQSNKQTSIELITLEDDDADSESVSILNPIPDSNLELEPQTILNSTSLQNGNNEVEVCDSDIYVLSEVYSPTMESKLPSFQQLLCDTEGIRIKSKITLHKLHNQMRTTPKSEELNKEVLYNQLVRALTTIKVVKEKVNLRRSNILEKIKRSEQVKGTDKTRKS